MMINKLTVDHERTYGVNVRVDGFCNTKSWTHAEKEHETNNAVTKKEPYCLFLDRIVRFSTKTSTYQSVTPIITLLYDTLSTAISAVYIKQFLC